MERDEIRFVWFEDQNYIYAYRKGWALKFEKSTHKYCCLLGHFDPGEFKMRVQPTRKIVKPKDHREMIAQVHEQEFAFFFNDK